MSLHVKRFESAGAADRLPLMLIHGWGMHGGVWGGVAESLARHFPVLAVDLPGHGYSSLPSPASGERETRAAKPAKREGSERAALSLTLSRARERGPDLLDAIVDQLSAQFTEPLALCGWSMGGQIATRWALRDPRQVQRLVLVASTPCFAERADWQHGMPQDTLRQFAAELEQDYAATLRRFLGLQVRGSEGERELLAALRASLSSRGEPDPDALRAGLDILRDLDLRDALPEVRQPALVIAGERDRLSPPQASHYLAQAMPNARAVEIRGAAHAPFLSHRDEFLKQVLDFMGERQA